MKIHECDYLIIGCGLAGLAAALKAAKSGSVILISKSDTTSSNTSMAQGGIAAAVSSEDSFEKHIQDTLTAGAGLCERGVVENIVSQAPERIQDLVNWGVHFDSIEIGGQKTVDLTREGGHSKRRILHVEDHTGRDIHIALMAATEKNPNITLLSEHFAVDLITNRNCFPDRIGPLECYGSYLFDGENFAAVLSKYTMLATGGAGKVFRYTSNWSGATGDGIAMAWRAGGRVANMEFTQFHPTCLYHAKYRSFLISEAVRGEGGVLLNHQGERFMPNYDLRAELAPRDIVARSIDAEMKMSGADCVFLDISKLNTDFIQSRFPIIFQRCKSAGLDIAKEPIPVVPAAHYLCGGVLTDHRGRTDIDRLYALGETACTGLHGANRLASNSLLECLAIAENAVSDMLEDTRPLEEPTEVPSLIPSQKTDPDELIVIHHLWDEIRSLMWNYVGIVRTNKRLARAIHRLDHIRSEIHEYYDQFRPHSDIMEVRNIALVASLIVRSARKREESRGTHFNADFPESLGEARNTVL